MKVMGESRIKFVKLLTNFNDHLVKDKLAGYCLQRKRLPGIVIEKYTLWGDKYAKILYLSIKYQLNKLGTSSLKRLHM